MKEFSLPVRVYIEDTDAGGIVYYVNYLKFMERCRTEMLRALGFGKAGANQSGEMFVVRSAEIDYRKPARLDDELVVVTKVAELARASIRFHQEVRRSDELCCSAEVRIACVDGRTLKPTAIPDAMSRALTENSED